MTWAPSARAITVALVLGLGIATLAPPFASLAIVAVALAVGGLAHADARRAGPTVSVSRETPARTPLGEWATVAWNVRAGSNDVRGLVFAEQLPAHVPSRGASGHVRLPAGGVDRRVGAVRPMLRGVLRLEPTAGRVLGPWGLGWRCVHWGPPQEIRVDPPVDALRALSLDTQRTRWSGGATRRLRGIGSEFESLRDYRPDDDSRWIDWKASARRRKWTSREYQVDEHRSVVFLIDTGRMMTSEDGERSKLDHALGAALALAHVAMRRGDYVGLCAFDRRVSAELKPGRGTKHAVRVHDALARLAPSLVEPDYERAFAQVSRRVRKRSLMLVFTDLVDERVSEALIRATARASQRHVVVVITLTDRDLLERVARHPETELDAYECEVAADALLLRDAAITRLRSSGVRVVDAPADRLAAGAVETYLRVRSENRV